MTTENGKTRIDKEWAVRLLPISDRVHTYRGSFGTNWDYRDAMKAIDEAESLWIAAPTSVAWRMGHPLIIEDGYGGHTAFEARDEMVERALEKFG